MNGADEQDVIQWQDALRWLDRAADDIRATRSLLRDGIGLQAAFHVQQAVEKCLKALLVAARKDVRKTHDLDTLAELARQHWPTLVTAPFPLRYVSRWYIVSRYPGDDDTGPTSDEVRTALPEVAALLSAVLALAPAALAAEVEAIGRGCAEG
jgi:HEPN domain-containing protein